jgi:uncharacterized protein YndB with AHSA1/START domain
MSDILRTQARLGATPATVYHALTHPEALRTWLAEHADVSLPHRRFAFWGRTTPQGQPDRQQLLAAEPERLLRFVWTLDGEPTTVDIQLRPDGHGTALSLRHDNLPSLEELMAPPGRRDGRHTMHTFWGQAVANLAAHVEGRELLPMADFSATRSPEIRIELAIDAAVDDVFASLIDPARIRDWFGWEAQVEPHAGGRATLGIDGKIFEFDPPKRLGYADGQGAVVRWELAYAGGRTHLTFVQSGYADTELDNAAQHEAGWLGSLAELRRMHELGDAWAPLTTELPADDG